jgi:hypothetical protein
MARSSIPHAVVPANNQRRPTPLGGRAQGGKPTTRSRPSTVANAARTDHHGLGTHARWAKPLPPSAGQDRCQQQTTLRSDHRPLRISRPLSDRATPRETQRHRATETTA